jgi:hypothetical protein
MVIVLLSRLGAVVTLVASMVTALFSFYQNRQNVLAYGVPT